MGSVGIWQAYARAEGDRGADSEKGDRRGGRTEVDGESGK